MKIVDEYLHNDTFEINLILYGPRLTSVSDSKNQIVTIAQTLCPAKTVELLSCFTSMLINAKFSAPTINMRDGFFLESKLFQRRDKMF